MSRGLRPRSSGAGDRRPPRRHRDLEGVRFRADRPDRGLKTGEVGTIAHVFDAADAYLIELVNDDGSTRALAEPTPRRIAPA